LCNCVYLKRINHIVKAGNKVSFQHCKPHQRRSVCSWRHTSLHQLNIESEKAKKKKFNHIMYQCHQKPSRLNQNGLSKKSTNKSLMSYLVILIINLCLISTVFSSEYFFLHLFFLSFTYILLMLKKLNFCINLWPSSWLSSWISSWISFWISSSTYSNDQNEFKRKKLILIMNLIKIKMEVNNMDIVQLTLKISIYK